MKLFKLIEKKKLKHDQTLYCLIISLRLKSLLQLSSKSLKKCSEIRFNSNFKISLAEKTSITTKNVKMFDP